MDPTCRTSEALEALAKAGWKASDHDEKFSLGNTSIRFRNDHIVCYDHGHMTHVLIAAEALILRLPDMTAIARRDES